MQTYLFLYSGMKGRSSVPTRTASWTDSPGGGVSSLGFITMMTSEPSVELLFWRRKRPISGTVARPAIPVIVRASDDVIRPANVAHSPSFSVTVDLTWRFATTGIPFSAVPASSLNSASTSKVTSSLP